MIGDMSRVAAGQVIAQLINLSALPVITRFYNPDVFGVFAVFSAVTWILVVLVTLQAEHLIITMRTRRLAKALTFAILASVFVCCILTIAVLEVFSFIGWISPFTTRLPDLSIWLGLTVAVIAVNQVLRYYATYLGKFKAYGNSVVLNSIGLVSVTIGYAAFIDKSAPVLGLILGQITGMVLSIIPYLLYTDLLRLRELKLVRMSGRILRAELSKLPILLVTHLSKTLSFRIPVFIVASVGGEVSAGAYAMADRLVSIPTGVFGQSIGQVFRHRFKSDKHDSVRQLEQPRIVIKASFILALVAYGIFIYFADILVLLVLGESWAVVVPFVRLVAAMEMMNFVFYSVEDVAVIRGIFVYRMLWQFGQLCLLSALFLFASISNYFDNVEHAVIVVCSIRILFVAYDLSRTWRNVQDLRLGRLNKWLKIH